MSADNWLTVAIAGFSTAGIATITSVVLFFVLHIRAVQGELSGRTEAREMKAMRENNDRLAERKNRYEPEYADARWGAEETEGIQEQEVSRQGEETSLLHGGGGQKTEGTRLPGGNGGRKTNGTNLPGGNRGRRTEGTRLPGGNQGRRTEGTSLLGGNGGRGTNGTNLLGENKGRETNGTEILGQSIKQEWPEFTITRRIIEIHTEEQIRGS